MARNDAVNGRLVLDPVKFQVGWLGRRLWQKQKEIARSVRLHEQTAVKGCHASGKTYLASGLPLEWLARHQEVKILTTAPTLRQVKLLWEEIALALRQSRLAAMFPEPTVTGLRLSDDRYAIGASSSRGINVQGFHAKNVLVIGDESPGIEPDIWDAVEGIRAGGNVHTLKMGNPVVPVGEFYDSFHKNRAIHNCISISAFDTPNFQDPLTGLPITIEQLQTMTSDALDYNPFPNLIRRRWVLERLKTWGFNHPKFKSRVLAEFPSQSPYSVFELAWIEKAKREASEKELAASERYMIQVGLDVAGAGSDETALCARVNGMVMAQHAWPDPDPRGAVVKILGELKHHPKYRLGVVVVDIVGIGYNFALHLADQGFPVVGFIAGAKPVEPMLYANQKAEAYFTAREWLKLGLVSGLVDEECEAQLSTCMYRENSRGLTEIWDKDEMRKTLGVPSPDRAEAFVMAFMNVVPQTQTATYADSGRSRQISPY